MNTMGQVFTGLGLYGDSRDLLEKALDKRRAIAAVDVTELNESISSLARVVTLLADYERAELLYREAIEKLEQ